MKFKVGDRVRIVRKVERENGWNDVWLVGMDPYVDDNQVYTVLRLDHHGIKLKEISYYWPMGALELVEDKMKIDLNKTYKTRCGFEVKLFEQIDNKIFGAVKNDVWGSCAWSLDGIAWSSHLQLIEINPYEHIKIDDRVLVWDNSTSEKCKRHFAGVDSNGKPTTWYGGATSWSSLNSDYRVWDNCELYTKD